MQICSLISDTVLDIVDSRRPADLLSGAGDRPVLESGREQALREALPHFHRFTLNQLIESLNQIINRITHRITQVSAGRWLLYHLPFPAITT